MKDQSPRWLPVAADVNRSGVPRLRTVTAVWSSPLRGAAQTRSTWRHPHACDHAERFGLGSRSASSALRLGFAASVIAQDVLFTGGGVVSRGRGDRGRRDFRSRQRGRHLRCRVAQARRPRLKNAIRDECGYPCLPMRDQREALAIRASVSSVVKTSPSRSAGAFAWSSSMPARSPCRRACRVASFASFKGVSLVGRPSGAAGARGLCAAQSSRFHSSRTKSEHARRASFS